MTSNIKICPQCGAANEPDANFCGYCGARMTPTVSTPASASLNPAQNVCPHCGYPVNPEWAFCKYCGQPLRPTTPQGNVFPAQQYPSTGFQRVAEENKKIHSFTVIWVFYGFVLLIAYLVGSSNLFFVALGATLPAILILFYFYQKDTYKEPGFLVLKVFLTGVLVALPAFIIELILYYIGFNLQILSNRLTAALYQAFVIAALTEEFLKFWAMKVHVKKSPDFDEPKDGIVYGVAAALGFAAIENFLYALNNMSNIVLLLIMRGLLSVPLHSIAGGLSGYYFAKWYFYDSKLGEKQSTFRFIKLSILLHGSFNFFLFLFNGTSLILLGLLADIIILIVALKMLSNRSKELDRLEKMMIQNPIGQVDQENLF